MAGLTDTLAVASGDGGVGESPAAVKPTVALRESDLTMGLMDGDIRGPNVPWMSMGFLAGPGQAGSADWAVVRLRAWRRSNLVVRDDAVDGVVAELCRSTQEGEVDEE